MVYYPHFHFKIFVYFSLAFNFNKGLTRKMITQFIKLCPTCCSKRGSNETQPRADKLENLNELPLFQETASLDINCLDSTRLENVARMVEVFPSLADYFDSTESRDPREAILQVVTDLFMSSSSKRARIE